MKPTVLLDVDGVLADFVGAALGYLHGLTGRWYDADTIRTWEVFDSLPPEEQPFKEEVYARLKTRGGCTSIAVYGGAKEGVARLREIADVVVVTSPFGGSETWMHERETWLGEHFGIDRHDVIHASKKARIHGDVFVDDKTSHAVEWVGYWTGGRAVLWHTPRSADDEAHPRILRARSWDDVIEVVRSVANRRDREQP